MFVWYYNFGWQKISVGNISQNRSETVLDLDKANAKYTPIYFEVATKNTNVKFCWQKISIEYHCTTVGRRIYLVIEIEQESDDISRFPAWYLNGFGTTSTVDKGQKTIEYSSSPIP